MTTSSSAPIRVGFLGAGLIAAYHSKSLRRSGAAVVRAGVYDPNAERSASFAAASGHTVCDSEDSVIDSCDAVYICTWTNEHSRLLAKVVAAGRHVFCEKPLAFTTDDALQMAQTASAAGVTHQVGLVLRRSPAYLWAKHLIDDLRQRRHIVIEGDDWFGPVNWTDADGASGSLSHDELGAAVAPMRDGSDNPDGEFIRAIQEGRAATPDLFTAVRAHQIVDAMYASAAADGAATDVPASDAS